MGLRMLPPVVSVIAMITQYHLAVEALIDDTLSENNPKPSR